MEFFTGRSPEILNDQVKVRKIKQITKDYSNKFMIGFGDSPGDIPMLVLLSFSLAMM